MTRQETYRLASLRLGTVFDDPVESLRPPGVADRGSSTALFVLDGANRLPKRLARAIRPNVLIGLKVAHSGRPVRVTMTLQVDARSAEVWERVHEELGDPATMVETTVHRIVQVSAQGRPRGLAVLALREADVDRVVRCAVRFDLDAAELAGDVLMMGLEPPPALPEWARTGSLAHGAVGLTVAHVKVEPVEGELRPRLRTGRPPSKSGSRLAELGFVVVDPGAAKNALRVRLRAPAAEEGKRHSLLAGRRRGTQRDAAVRVEVVSLSGLTLFDDEVAAAAVGVYDVQLPSSAEPVLVRAGDDASMWAVELRR